MLRNPGAPFTYFGEERRYSDARPVCWVGDSPFHHHQDLDRLTEAWTRPETITVRDPMMTATERWADIVLPATTSIERNDLEGNRRSDFILAMVKVIDPVREARSDSDIFNTLAERLGRTGAEDAFHLISPPTEGAASQPDQGLCHQQGRKTGRAGPCPGQPRRRRPVWRCG